MTYSSSFRECVISHIAEGGSKASASRLFNLSSNTIHRWWLARDDLSPKRKRHGGSYKLDRGKLINLVERRPDSMLKELAAELNVSINAVHHSLKVMGYTRKKNGTLQREAAL